MKTFMRMLKKALGEQVGVDRSEWDRLLQAALAHNSTPHTALRSSRFFRDISQKLFYPSRGTWASLDSILFLLAGLRDCGVQEHLSSRLTQGRNSGNVSCVVRRKRFVEGCHSCSTAESRRHG